MKSKLKSKAVKKESLNSTDHLDLTQAMPAPDMPHLKPSTVTVNLRMPLSMVNKLKQQANKKDVPYQSYMKMLLSQALQLKNA